MPEIIFNKDGTARESILKMRMVFQFHQENEIILIVINYS